MTAGDTQVKMLYEQGVSPEEIAETLGMETAAVKATLLSVSNVYRRRVNGKDSAVEEAVSPDEFSQIKEAYFSMALDGDTHPHVKEKMLRFLWNEHKGRNELVQKTPTGPGINLVVLNNQIQQAKERATKAINAASHEVVEL